MVLVAVAVAPWPLGYFSAVYGLTSLALGAGMFALAVNVYRHRTGSQALRATLSAAHAVYHPDAERSTAGIHFAAVLKMLGIADALQARLHAFPNGATAMRALAASTAPHAIGCTQVSEILYTPGITLAGTLPAPFELATAYAAAVSAAAAEPGLGQRFVAMLTGDACKALRRAGGFEC